MKIFEEVEEKFIGAFEKGYNHIKCLDLEHDIQKLAKSVGINSIMGYIRNFYIRAHFITNSDCKYEMEKISSYKYPVFKIENTTFTLLLHYFYITFTLHLHYITKAKD